MSSTRGVGMALMLGLGWALLCTPHLQAAPAAQAAASAIVYRCGNDLENLCRYTFDGAAPTQLTNDGVAKGPLYTSPSLSADGTKLAFSFGNLAYIADGNAANRTQGSNARVVFASLRPDGARLATVELLLEQAGLTCDPTVSNPGTLCRVGFYTYGVRTFQRGFVPYLFTYNASGGDKHTELRVPATFGWFGNRIMIDSKYNIETKHAGVCLLVVNDFNCERTLAEDPKHTLVSPAMSPDGSLLAVTSCAGDAPLGTCSIALYAEPSGSYLRDISTGPNDAAPVWSPDGRTVAFGRDQSIWVVDRDGSAGSERMLIPHGMQPTWALFPGGAPPAAEPAPAADPLEANLADERTNWGVPAQDAIQSRVGTRTPVEIPGGKTVTTADVVRAMRAHLPLLLVDALADDHAQTLAGAMRLPDAGQPGAVGDEIQDNLAQTLDEQTEGDLSTPIVFFCAGAECWESYNASLRAIHAGYTNVYWYRGGLAAWAAAKLPLE
jgi:PQQ-dependent catabolism-associated CXXCW motif protein